MVHSIDIHIVYTVKYMMCIYIYTYVLIYTRKRLPLSAPSPAPEDHLDRGAGAAPAAANPRSLQALRRRRGLDRAAAAWAATLCLGPVYVT